MFKNLADDAAILLITHHIVPEELKALAAMAEKSITTANNRPAVIFMLRYSCK